MILSIAGIIVFSLLLIKAADWVIVALRRISRNIHAGVFALSAVILSIGTTLPELFVGVASALENQPNIALGVVLGSNIANVGLVLGITGFVAGRVNVSGRYVSRDIIIAFVASALPLLLVFDGSLSRIDGLILLAVYGAYATSFFHNRYMEIAEEARRENFIYRFVRQFNDLNGKGTREFGRLFVGVAALLFSADMIVRFSVSLAETINIPLLLVGMVVLAVGTSLPELVFAIRSTRGHEPSMLFGNLLGATIANSTLILGVTSVVNPIRIVAFEEYTKAVFFFFLVYVLFWIFTRTKHRLERWEAVVLVGVYLAFILVTFV